MTLEETSPKGAVCQSCSKPLCRDEKGGGTDRNGQKSASSVTVMAFLLCLILPFSDERACACQIKKHVYTPNLSACAKHESTLLCTQH